MWSDLQFRYFSFRLELGQTLQFSASDAIKSLIVSREALLKQNFQQAILTHPGLLKTFLRNAGAQLSSQQLLFTKKILAEYQDLKKEEAPKIAETLQKLAKEKTENFARARGLAAPVASETLSELKVLTANMVCFPDKLPYTYGGISPWKGRIERLTETIRKTGAQIVCLQEVWDPEAMRALMEHFKEDYAFFIYEAGDPAGTLYVSKMGYNSGLFIASKVPLDTVIFNRFPRSIPEGSNRGALIVGFQIFQRQCALINTHLQHGSTPEMLEMRKEQLHFCHTYLQDVSAKTPSSWGFLTGDLNIDGFSPEFTASSMPSLFAIPYMEELSSKKATCTNYFTDLVVTPPAERGQVPISYELLDYCIQSKPCAVMMKSQQTLIPLYSLEAPTQALSDHQVVLTTWTAP